MTPPSSIRVAIATPSYPPDLGGLGSLVKELATALSAEGCDTTVLTQTREGEIPPSKVSACTRGEPEVIRFPNRVGGHRFGYAPSLRRHARTMGGEVDVVHAFSFHAPVAMAVNNVTEAPFFFSPVFHSSGHSTLANAAHVLYRPLAKRVFNRADSVLCLSQAERKEVIKLYPFCEDWARVVPLAVDEARFTGLAPFDVDVPVILSAGRLDSYKRVDLVIDAMQVVGESAKLVICGAGPDEQRLRNLISERGVERVVDFVGAVSDEDLRRWQLTATVTVSLSTHESFGLSLAEAVVAGSAIVASDIPAHREMADVMGGAPRFLPESADAAEVASALTGALRAGRPIRGARAHREWADVARDTIAIYEGAISHPRGGQ